MKNADNMILFENEKNDKPEAVKILNKIETKKEKVLENVGKAIRLEVPDFNDPNRKPTCLEVDFPIAQINALSNLEGNAGKPIYQMSKWWARRRSSIFRSMLIAAASQAPDDHSEAAKIVWEHYYCNHQKAGSFKKIKVLDCFMGGGTTLVEGSRLGMQMTGVDLNPVAWFVVKNELACSDPDQVKLFFDYIESEVKPQIQPFYTTSCPRGHKGNWIEVNSGKVAEVNPAKLPPEERKKYRWEGPEIIYTFWAKHGPCQAKGCNHRTPIFNSPIIAEKKLSTDYIELTCPKCRFSFHAELGETRMAPGSERVILEGETPFTEISQKNAKLLNDYDKGSAQDTFKRAETLFETMQEDAALTCPSCGTFSGKHLVEILEIHAKPATKSSQRKKKIFGIKRKNVKMTLLINPDWFGGTDENDSSAQIKNSANFLDNISKWAFSRLENLQFIEARGENLPSEITNKGNKIIKNNSKTTCKSGYVCSKCGREQNLAQSLKEYQNTAPVAAYTFQCYCPQCDNEGYNYGGRYFKEPDEKDIDTIIKAESEWHLRHTNDLKEFYPQNKVIEGYNTNQAIGHNYTHWSKMFNSRQLLVHSQLLKTITDAPEDKWPLDIKEQLLGIFQQYLRNQNSFCFWDRDYDKLVPMMSNANYHPKMLTVENCVFHRFGRGNFESNISNAISGLQWSQNPWELFTADSGVTKSEKLFPNDSVLPTEVPYCCSSTDLSMLKNESLDLVITDPPFGNNLFYADLSDFFYAWLRIPLSKWFVGLPEQKYFLSERTPHSIEAVDNPIEHPDDRLDYEKNQFVEAKHILKIREITGNDLINEKDINPLYRPEPSSEFYSNTLSTCWAEAGRLLKPSGIMAFTFHHNEDQAWVDVLKALFDAGYYLITTYPIRSDETKGESGAFGSRKIEYDIIHVCRKRLEKPQPVSWARMRKWVKEEAHRLKLLLEQTHGKELPESDLLVILRGKSLEFYSRHYGQVLTGEGQILDVREALLGINQLLEDLIEEKSQQSGRRPPDIAEPASRLYLRLFIDRTEIERDELHKMLRGTGFSQSDFEVRGWVRTVGKTIHLIPIKERFDYFIGHGRNRKNIKIDLDQAHLLIGAAMPDSGRKIDDELNGPNFKIKKSVDEILKWYSETESSLQIKHAAITALHLVEHWRSNKLKMQKESEEQLTLFEMLEVNE